jgi:anti-anti-sigma factor
MTKTPSRAQRHPRFVSPGAMWDPQRKVVWLRGAQNASTVPELCAAIARAIAFDQADLLLDLSDVTSLDEAVVEVVDLAREYLRQRSRSFALRSPRPPVRRLLVLCGLSELLDATQGNDESDAGNYRVVQPMASLA